MFFRKYIAILLVIAVNNGLAMSILNETSSESANESTTTMNAMEMIDSMGDSSEQFPLYIGDELDDSSDNSTDNSTLPSDDFDMEESESSIDETIDSLEMSVDNSTLEYNVTLENKTTSEANDFENKATNGTKFTCYGREFGQYADVNEGCRMFHLCYPYVSGQQEELVYQRISFLCHGNAVFDQKNLVCVDNSTLDYPCEESTAFYGASNEDYVSRILSYINPNNGQRTGGTAAPAYRRLFNWLGY